MLSLLLRFTKIYTGAKRLFLLFFIIVLSIAQETVQNTKPILFEKCIKYVGKWARDFKSKSGSGWSEYGSERRSPHLDLKEEIFCEMLF